MMKNLFILIFFILLSGIIKSQESIKYFLNGTSLDSIKSEYFQIVGASKFMSTKLNVVIDHGQWTGWKQEYKLTDNAGKKIELTTMIEALNFMAKNGFDYVDSFAYLEDNSPIYHYILRRKEKK